MSLPHRFPLELVDRVDGSEARLSLTAGSWWGREELVWPLVLVVEAAAQSVARVAGVGAAVDLALAGVESARLERLPEAGEAMRLTPRLGRTVGPVTRAAVEVRAGGALLGEVVLLLAARKPGRAGV